MMALEHYFDYNSTTPVAQEVLAKMMPYFNEVFANPSAQNSEQSFLAAASIEKAKKQIGEHLNCLAKDVYFTSGATESINWVLENFMREDKDLCISQIDHDATYVKSKEYKKVHFFKNDERGHIDEESFFQTLEKVPSGSLLSLIYAHNELGTVINLKNLIGAIKSKKCFLHLDITQAIGKIKIDLQETQADFLSFSCHKFYGPKGVGALIINSDFVTGFKPLFLGGGQQKGLRSGTLNTPGLVGMGEAFELCTQRLEADQKHYLKLREIFLKGLSNLKIKMNTPLESSISNTLNISFLDWNSRSPLFLELRPFAVGQTSACSANKGEARILDSLKISPSGTIRVSFGRHTTEQGVLKLVQKIKSCLGAF